MDKLWATSRGPVLSTDAEVRRCQAINAMLIRPIAILPAARDEHILPFAIGLFEEIRALLKPDLGASALRRAVAAYVHSKRYYFASAQLDAIRYNIDRQPVEPVSEADRLVAQRRFLQHKGKNPESAPGPQERSDSQVIKNDQVRGALLGRTKRSDVKN